jgi:Rab9 effector protein with kelch motifs
MSSSRALSDVAEEPAGSNSPAASDSVRASPYLHTSQSITGSTSTFNATGTNGTAQSPRTQQALPRMPSQPSSLRTVKSSKDIKRTASGSPSGSAVTSPTTKDTSSKSHRTNGVRPATSTQKIRNTPRLAHDYEIESAAATMMYWSRAPVYGAIPMRSMRAHSVTLVDSVAWLFGGCDDKGCWKDIYCFDTGALALLMVEVPFIRTRPWTNRNNAMEPP